MIVVAMVTRTLSRTLRLVFKTIS